MASRAHASARRAVSAHVKKGTLNTPQGHAAVKASAAAARTLQAARATKKTEYAAAAKTRRAAARTTAATPKAQATTQLKADHAAANPAKVAAQAPAKPAAKPTPSPREQVVAASKEATDIKTKVAAGHLGDLKGGSATDKAVEKLARGHSKDELFAVAKGAGIEHKATTKKALVEHLKAHFAATAKPAEAPKARGTPNQRAAAANARAEARTRAAEVAKRKLIHDGKGGINKAITPEQKAQAQRHDRTTERAAKRTAQIEQARQDVNRAAVKGAKSAPAAKEAAARFEERKADAASHPNRPLTGFDQMHKKAAEARGETYTHERVARANRAIEAGKEALAAKHPASASPEQAAKDVLHAYAKVADGPNTRVYVADLRLATPHLSDKEFDAGLLEAALSGKASAYKNDDTPNITPRDRKYAFRTPAGDEAHIVYAGGRGT